MHPEARIALLERENDELREHVRRLEDALIGTFETPFEWGLTAAERIVFGVLVNREVASKDAMMAALYRSMGKDEPDPKIVDVFVCKLRRKVKPYGITIRTHWGTGWQLDDTTRRRFGRSAAA